MKSQHKIVITKVLTVLILTASFHYFVPIFNRSIDDKCCTSGKMQCCRDDFPSRMVCCTDHDEQDSTNSVPTQGILGYSPLFSKNFIPATPLTVWNTTLPTIEHFDKLTRWQFIVEDNHRYIKLSSFLI